MPVLLDVRSLSVSYGPSVVLSGVDIAVPEGAVVGILGPNGAGKSTLLRTVAGLVKPASGAIFFGGERADRLPANALARRGICLIPQGRGILPSLSVADNLKLATARDPGALARALDRFPVLAERAPQAAGTLSGGEQQMLALSRAFDESVRLLLIDEPSLGLAPRLVTMVEETVRQLHGDGCTVVWVEQYASRVLKMADIMYILGRGRVRWAGEASELNASPVLIKSYLGGSAVD